MNFRRVELETAQKLQVDQDTLEFFEHVFMSEFGSDLMAWITSIPKCWMSKLEVMVGYVRKMPCKPFQVSSNLKNDNNLLQPICPWFLERRQTSGCDDVFEPFARAWQWLGWRWRFRPLAAPHRRFQRNAWQVVHISESKVFQGGWQHSLCNNALAFYFSRCSVFLWRLGHLCLETICNSWSFGAQFVHHMSPSLKCHLHELVQNTPRGG